MSIEEINKESIRRCTEEVFNKGNLSAIPEVFSPEFVEYSPGGQILKGLENLKQMVEMSRNAFPDMHYEIEDMFAEGDKLAVRYTFTGTFKGEIMGMSPTGKKFKISSAYLCHMKDGKQLEVWGYIDMLTWYQQLGISPPGQ
jgi:steroid delta-isomerase-like uncharacterized protein